MKLVPNRPTDLGIQLGEQVGRLADIAEQKRLAQFPGAKTRCSSCAFRTGTFPNGCESTLADAVKCVIEKVPFYCHEVPHDTSEEERPLCAGWVSAQAATSDFPITKVPYKFSHEDSD